MSINQWPMELVSAAAPTDGESVVVTLTGSGVITGGTFDLTLPTIGAVGGVDWDVTADELQGIIDAATFMTYGELVVDVTGGPLPGTPIVITYINQLGGKPVSGSVTVDDSLIEGDDPMLNSFHDPVGSGAVNEQVTLTMTGTPTGGTFTLTVGATPTTAPISYGADAATIQAALEAVEGIGAGNVAVSGVNLMAGLTVEFQGALAATNINTVVADSSSLTGGTNPTLNVAVVAEGAAVANQVTKIDGYNNITGGTWTITVEGDTTGDIAYNANAATIQSALEALDAVGVGDVVVTGGPINTAQVVLTFAAGMAGMELAVTVDDSSLTGGPGVAGVKDPTGTQGSYRGAPEGSLVKDTTNYKLYKNVGDRYVPTWKELGTEADL